MNSLILTSIEQGLIFSILAMGVFITYKVLDIADLSVEGSFPLGAFIFAKFMTLGLNPLSSIFMAFFFGSLAGLFTAILFIKLKIKPLLAGILTMTILYSVNLRTNGGRSNIPLYSFDSIFDYGSIILIASIFALIIKLLIDLFLKTEAGYMLIATGDNPSLVKSLGQNSDKYRILGLMLANGLVGLSGALMAQFNGFVDITMGNSIIVIALASIIIGDSFMKNSSKLKNTSRAILGAILYRIIGGIAIDLGLEPSDLRAISGIIVIVFIAYNNMASSLFNLKLINKKKEIKTYADIK